MANIKTAFPIIINIATTKKQRKKTKPKPNVLNKNRNQVIKLALKESANKHILSNTIPATTTTKTIAMKQKYVSFAKATVRTFAPKIADTLIIIATMNGHGFYAFTKDLTPVTVTYSIFKPPRILTTCSRSNKFWVEKVKCDIRHKYLFQFKRNTNISKLNNNIKFNWNLLKTFGDINNLAKIAEMDNNVNQIQVNIYLFIRIFLLILFLRTF